MLRLLVTLLAITGSACTQTQSVRQLMDSTNPKVSRVAQQLDNHEVQIMFSEVFRTPQGELSYSEQVFQVDDERYFYPASTVKLPVALLALEKLAEDPRIDRETPFYIEGDLEPTTIAQEISKLFVVSDNDAYNRLFEYLGKDEINRRLASKAIKGRIAHRLSVPNSDLLNYKPVFFATEQGDLRLQAPQSKPIERLQLSEQSKGISFVDDDKIVNRPFDFSQKNYLPIRSLHGIIKRLFFPQSFTVEQQFHLPADDREFVLEAMQTLPFELGYDREEFYDSYVKFLIFGDNKKPLPSHIKIANKVGFAYGTLTDTAYIKDLKQNREFIITATILVNENQTFNDDNYEYDMVGIPFLAELGRLLTGAAP